MTPLHPTTNPPAGLGSSSPKFPCGLRQLNRIRSGCSTSPVAMLSVSEVAERRFPDPVTEEKPQTERLEKKASNGTEWMHRLGSVCRSEGFFSSDREGGSGEELGEQVFNVQIVDPRTERSAGTPGPGKGDDYYANVGKAVETLKEETPYMFEQELTYDIYRDDIIFKDRKNSFQGLKFYKYMFLSLRCHGRVFFKRVFVEVRNIWLPQEGEIRVRWTIHGIPRIPWEAEGIFDGVSTYKLDNDGKIYVHCIDNIIFRDPPVVQLPVFFNLSLNPTPVQQPCPGAWCRMLFFFQRFSWIRMYVAILSTMQVLNLSTPRLAAKNT
ncbi:hypothetical protein BSKO_06487 [Bryopsis sp. KO-2023]|nr:hypothetical protein BSKO_06487 [Bryopsis sp. KO-2023]